jgi:hypothetical protein
MIKTIEQLEHWEATIAALPSQERKVFESLGEGLSVSEVAYSLGIAETTTRTYVERIRQRLHCRVPIWVVAVSYKLARWYLIEFQEGEIRRERRTQGRAQT